MTDAHRAFGDWGSDGPPSQPGAYGMAIYPARPLMLPPTDADTLELRISVPFAHQEPLVALLDERGAQGFVQEDNALVAYFPAGSVDDR